MWKKSLSVLFLVVSASGLLFAQIENAATGILNSDTRLTLGGYAQVDYNQGIKPNVRQNGTLDVHRMVLLFGYKFSSKTQFVTELEMEHVSEVYVEQAFLDHSLLPGLNFRAGLLLVPMGLTNLYHEPTSFFGVERPNIDAALVPTTWREIGAGFAGQLQNLSIKYELYVMNGFSGYNGSGVLRGVDGFRKGRQKGMESFMSSPVFAGRLNYYGLPNLNFGFSSYLGKTQSSLFNKLNTLDNLAVAAADSSRVQLALHGLDARYSAKGIRAKAQVYFAAIDHTVAYNEFTGKDLGSQFFGYYIELGYNVLRSFKTEYELIPFVRFEVYDTHHQTQGSLTRNPAFSRTELTTGLSCYLAKGAVLKVDLQFLGNEGMSGYTKQLNCGVGIWF